MAEDIIDLTEGLYRFMVASEELLIAGRLRKQDAKRAILHQARELAQRFHDSKEWASSRLEGVYENVSTSLSEWIEQLNSRRPTVRSLKDHWTRLGKQYDALVSYVGSLRCTLPRDVALGELKPRNYARNLFHVSLGVIGILLYEFVLSRTATLAIGGGILAIFLFLEVMRKRSAGWNEKLLKVFGKMGRLHETRRVCTSTWYMGGLVIGVFLFPRHAIAMGTLVLAFADPVASLVGKRWGQLKIHADKSLAGTIGFFATSLVMCTLFMWWLVPTVSPTAAVGAAAVISLAGALTELLSTRINDNLTIPLVAGAVATFLIM
ncbi:MAG: hypothetical protein JW797_05760 [Bradymonadales bacterium]|nr:hypothetical protein [Bradymonadales bacterium]